DGVEIDIVRADSSVAWKQRRLGQKRFVVGPGGLQSEAQATDGYEDGRVSERAIDEQIDFFLVHTL
ncbi:MAG: hypothetical protein ACYSTZ_01315, partial [Planctomycetota bacterium]